MTVRSRLPRPLAALLAALIVLPFLLPVPGRAATATGTSSNFQLVGHAPLFGRGVNAAGAVYGHVVYIGSRSDGSHLHSGVQIVDATDPAHPSDVGEIPLPADLTAGYTSRELRVWPQQKLLMVVYFSCSAILHACVSGADLAGGLTQRINFFDLTNPVAPQLVASYKPSVAPHELFLWVDPSRPATRALLYWTSPNSSAKQLVVTDISGWRTSTFPEIAALATPAFSAADRQAFDTRLHSISVSPDGGRTYLAYLGGGVFVVDSSDLAAGRTKPALRFLTPLAGRARWDNQGAHSTVPIPGRPYLFTTEEIYGKGVALNDAFGAALGGCPWGWARIIDDHDDTHLTIASEFRIDENQPGCAGITTEQDNFSSYASHNPTVLPDLAILTWHSGGLRAVDLCTPTAPVQDGAFVPTPDGLAAGHTTDPALEPGSNGTIAWSYPIIANGLIYYVDIVNGLYIVRYTGPHASEVAGTTFLEGNSNLLSAVTPPASDCPQGTTAAAPASAVTGAGGTTPNTGSGAVPAGLASLLAIALGSGRSARRRAAASPPRCNQKTNSMGIWPS